jgi:6-phosphogluconolactonase
MIAASPEVPVIVYASCATSREIWSFRLRTASGELDPLGVEQVPGVEGPSRSNVPLAFSPALDRLYAGIRAAPNPVSTYAVDPASGALTWLDAVPTEAPNTYLSTSRDGRSLLGASYTEHVLSVHRIDANGTLQAGASHLLSTPPKAHCILEGRHGVVYASTIEGNAILLFRLDAGTGVLIPANPPSITLRPHSKPRHLRLHPSLDVLYSINEHAGTVAAFAIDPADGGLAELQVVRLVPDDYEGNARAAELRVTDDGRFVFASVRNTHSIVIFAVDQQSGQLRHAGTFDAPRSPRGFAVDPTGRFLICASEDDDSLHTFAIDPDSGSLAGRHSYAIGKRPTWVEAINLPYALTA